MSPIRSGIQIARHISQNEAWKLFQLRSFNDERRLGRKRSIFRGLFRKSPEKTDAKQNKKKKEENASWLPTYFQKKIYIKRPPLRICRRELLLRQEEAIRKGEDPPVFEPEMKILVESTCIPAAKPPADPSTKCAQLIPPKAVESQFMEIYKKHKECFNNPEAQCPVNMATYIPKPIYSEFNPPQKDKMNLLQLKCPKGNTFPIPGKSDDNESIPSCVVLPQEYMTHMTQCFSPTSKFLGTDVVKKPVFPCPKKCESVKKQQTVESKRTKLKPFSRGDAAQEHTQMSECLIQHKKSPVQSYTQTKVPYQVLSGIKDFGSKRGTPGSNQSLHTTQNGLGHMTVQSQMYIYKPDVCPLKWETKVSALPPKCHLDKEQHWTSGTLIRDISPFNSKSSTKNHFTNYENKKNLQITTTTNNELMNPLLASRKFCNERLKQGKEWRDIELSDSSKHVLDASDKKVVSTPKINKRQLQNNQFLGQNTQSESTSNEQDLKESYEDQKETLIRKHHVLLWMTSIKKKEMKIRSKRISPLNQISKECLGGSSSANILEPSVKAINNCDETSASHLQSTKSAKIEPNMNSNNNTGIVQSKCITQPHVKPTDIFTTKMNKPQTKMSDKLAVPCIMDKMRGLQSEIETNKHASWENIIKTQRRADAINGKQDISMLHRGVNKDKTELSDPGENNKIEESTAISQVKLNKENHTCLGINIPVSSFCSENILRPTLKNKRKVNEELMVDCEPASHCVFIQDENTGKIVTNSYHENHHQKPVNFNKFLGNTEMTKTFCGLGPREKIISNVVYEKQRSMAIISKEVIPGDNKTLPLELYGLHGEIEHSNQEKNEKHLIFSSKNEIPTERINVVKKDNVSEYTKNLSDNIQEVKPVQSSKIILSMHDKKQENTKAGRAMSLNRQTGNKASLSTPNANKSPALLISHEESTNGERSNTVPSKETSETVSCSSLLFKRKPELFYNRAQKLYITPLVLKDEKWFQVIKFFYNKKCANSLNIFEHFCIETPNACWFYLSPNDILRKICSVSKNILYFHSNYPLRFQREHVHANHKDSFPKYMNVENKIIFHLGHISLSKILLQEKLLNLCKEQIGCERSENFPNKQTLYMPTDLKDCLNAFPKSNITNKPLKCAKLSSTDYYICRDNKNLNLNTKDCNMKHMPFLWFLENTLLFKGWHDANSNGTSVRTYSAWSHLYNPHKKLYLCKEAHSKGNDKVTPKKDIDSKKKFKKKKKKKEKKIVKEIQDQKRKQSTELPNLRKECKKIVLPGCKPPTKRKTCDTTPKRVVCEKIKMPYPSFSECVDEIPKLPFSECDCHKKPPPCLEESKGISYNACETPRMLRPEFPKETPNTGNKKKKPK